MRSIGPEEIARRYAELLRPDATQSLPAFNSLGDSVTLSARDFAILLSTCLGPFVRAGRTPEVARQVLEVGRRVGYRHVADCRPDGFNDEEPELDNHVVVYQSALEKVLEGQLLKQFLRFRTGGFFSLSKLELAIGDINRPVVSRPDLAVDVVPKMTVDVTVEVNQNVSKNITQLTGSDPGAFWTFSASPWKPRRAQRLSLYSWFIMGIVVVTVRRFIQGIGWHEPLLAGSNPSKEDILRDLDQSLLTFAEERDGGKETFVTCVYVADPLRSTPR